VHVDLAPGWTVELDRGPDWLFARLHGPTSSDAEGVPLAERLVAMLDNEFVHRIVLELDEIELLRSPLLGELVRLHKRVCSRDGVMRICGLSDSNYEVLRSSRLHDRFPRYTTREEAVLGYRRPNKPR
jgi:anti-anti-sigma factor